MVTVTLTVALRGDGGSGAGSRTRSTDIAQALEAVVGICERKADDVKYEGKTYSLYTWEACSPADATFTAYAESTGEATTPIYRWSRAATVARQGHPVLRNAGCRPSLEQGSPPGLRGQVR